MNNKKSSQQNHYFYLKSAYRFFDEKILLKLEALQVSGENDVVIELIESFLRQTTVRISNIATGLAVQDYKICSDECHTIKSSARTIGALQLADLCQQLENLCQQNTYEKMQVAYEEIQSEFLKLTEDLSVFSEKRILKKAI